MTQSCTMRKGHDIATALPGGYASRQHSGHFPAYLGAVESAFCDYSPNKE